MGRDAENSTREIDGLKVEVFLLPPKQALKVLTRLSKIVGEPLGLAAGALLGGQKGAETEAVPLSAREVQVDVLGKAVAALTDRLDEQVVLDTVETLLGSVHVKTADDNGTRPVRMEHDFKGKTLTMLKVVAFALEVNFSDFFGASGVSGGLLAKARAVMATT